MFGLNKKLKFNKNADALTQVYNAFSFYGEDKHLFNQNIINGYCNSTSQNDLLAVAISYLGEGASYRKNAINYFEKYLLWPTSQQYFSDWYIYSSLSTLYEKEHLFDKAINCLDKLIEIDKESNIVDYTRKGNVILKQNVDNAILYYEELKEETSLYLNYKNAIDEAYNNALLKKKKGYKFKPRNK